MFAATPYGSRVRESKNKNKRKKNPNGIRKEFINWVTADTNPTFALNITNRLWAHAMGVPVIEPMNSVMQDGEISIGKK